MESRIRRDVFQAIADPTRRAILGHIGDMNLLTILSNPPSQIFSTFNHANIYHITSFSLLTSLVYRSANH